MSYNPIFLCVLLLDSLQVISADLDADKDHFQDVERQETLKQKLDKELQAAPGMQTKANKPGKTGDNCQFCQTSL